MASIAPRRSKLGSLRRRASRAAVRIREGNDALRDGDLGSALRAYNAALDDDVENPYAWNNKGVVLEALGRDVEALRCHNRAIAIRPNYVEAWVNKGVALLHK